MKLLFKTFNMAALLLAGLAVSNLTYAAEPTLDSIIKTADANGYVATSFADIASQSWNVAGTKLTFSLLSENTRWSGSQTFGFNLSGVNGTTTVFLGAANAGAVTSYTLTSPLTGIRFASNTDDGNNALQVATADNNFSGFGGDYQAFKTSSGNYVFAYEDWERNAKQGDYNDMVIGMSVSAVPEPETYALMLTGLALIGIARRRLSQM